MKSSIIVKNNRFDLLFEQVFVSKRAFILTRTMQISKKIIAISTILITLGCGILAYDRYQNSDLSFFSSSEKAEKKEIKLILGGDIMLSRGIGRWGKKANYQHTFFSWSYHPLEQFPSFLSGSALLLFNLESPFSLKDNDQPQGGFLFRANTGNLQTLTALQSGNHLLLSLANNHTNNAGGAGIQLTRQILEEAGIDHLGAGSSTGEAQTIRSHTTSDLKLCAQAYSYDGTFNRFGGERLARNPLKEDLILDNLQTMQEQACDLKILFLHRGREYRIKPLPSQIDLAHRLVDAGADILIGGHSHVPWSFEIYQGKPIFYSLGNLLFDQDRGKKATGSEFDYIYDHQLQRKTVPTYIPLLAELIIRKENDSIIIDPPHFGMARIEKGQYQPLDEDTFAEILQQILSPL